MANKVLTVSVAAYNVASFLRETLDSCTIPEVVADLEVMIENDGSTDETAKIAEEYQKRYPNTFRLINKENGGYGTTVNRSIEEAQGKYFRLLDGDDRFNRSGLIKLVSFLKESDTDWVVTRRSTFQSDTDEQKEDNPLWLEYCDRVYRPDEIADSGFSGYIGMWQITVKTEILKKHMIKLPAHTLYTDQLYVYYQMPHVRTIAFQNYPVYEYRIGREEQSVSRTSSIKHASERFSNLNMMLEDYIKHSEEYSSNKVFIMHRLTRYYIQAIRLYCILPVSSDNRKAIMKLETKCKAKAKDVYFNAGRLNRRLFMILRYSHYLGYYLPAVRNLQLQV